MKQKLLLIVLFLSTLTHAQEYIPFLDNTTWTLTVAGFGFSEDTWIAPEDEPVTIDGYDYVSYTSVPLAGDVLIREDVAERRVYKNVDGTDELLYDFSLAVGETVYLPDGVTLTATARDSVVSMSGRKRVRISLQGTNSVGYPIYENWIEGVGTWAHPLQRPYDLPSDPATYIKCSFTDGEPAYNMGQVNTGNPVDCNEPAAGLDKVSKENVLIYDAPNDNGVIIATPLYLENATVKIYNTFGQIAKEIHAVNENKILIPKQDLATGIYFIQLWEKDNLVLNSKILLRN